MTKGHAAGAEKAGEERGGAGAVDVVIAENGDRLRLFDRAHQTIDRRLHVLQTVGIGHQGADRRIEKGGAVVGTDAARRDHAGEQIGMAMTLSDGERARVALAVEAVAPGLSEHGFLDAEEEAIRSASHARGGSATAAGAQTPRGAGAEMPGERRQAALIRPSLVESLSGLV